MTELPSAPVLVAEVDVARVLPELRATSPTGRTYASARCLVRVAGDPIGFVMLDLSGGDLGPAELARTIWAELGTCITVRAARCGVGPLHELGPDGLAIFQPRARASAAETLDATVVIATRDRLASLERCVCSIVAMRRRPAEVIVVDNAPAHDTALELVERLSSPAMPVRYVREDRPGLGIAHNTGLGHVRTALVAFTDDDVVVDELWLDRLTGAFTATDRVACVTGMIVPAELETREQLWIEQYAGFNKGFERKVFDLFSHRPDDPLFPFTAGTLGSGANMAFTTSSLRRLGGFDPALGTGSGAFGGDDLAAFHDVIVDGWRVVYEPSAIVRHHHHRSYPSLRRQVYGYGAGLTAFLTHCAVARPRSVFTMARRSVRALARVIRPGSSKNAGRPGDYPSALTWAERRGMLVGPAAYLRTRWKRRAPSWRLAPDTELMSP